MARSDDLILWNFSEQDVDYVSVEWSKLTDKSFEELCYDVLVAEDFRNLEWLGKGGGDRGRDIVATKSMEMTEAHETMYDYLVLCKRYLARPPAPSDLQQELAWADGHNPDVLMIMFPNTLTPDTHDWLKSIGPQKRYKILVYDEKDFERFFDRHARVYLKHFGNERVSPMKRILSSMLADADQTMQTISNDVQLSENEVETILRDLERRGIVSHQGPEEAALYRLEHNLAAFADVAKEFLADETRKFEFISSEYCRSLVGPELVNHIESRYHLVLDADHRVALAKLLKISPSALNTALFSPTDKYDTGYAHVEELKLAGDERNKWNESMLTEFMSTLFENAIADLRDPGVKTTLKQNEVEGYNLGIKIQMASSKGPVLNLGSEVTIMLVKAAGPIKAGQLVSATPDLFMRTGDILLHLDLLEQAIGEYDRAISGLKDAQKLAAAWNKKGVCLMALKRWNKAIPCFDKALEIRPALNEARHNKQKCEAALIAELHPMQK